MRNDSTSPVVRRLARAVALSPAVLLLTGSPAFADTPAPWPDSDSVSTLQALLVLLVIPLSLFVVITLLAYVPSLARGEKYKPGLAWRNENEWFGGPRGGLEAAENAEPRAIEGVEESGRGGASARW